MQPPARVDVRPSLEVILLDHVLDSSQIFDNSGRIVTGRWLHGGLCDDLRLAMSVCELDVYQNIGVELLAHAIRCCVNRKTDVVVENGEACHDGSAKTLSTAEQGASSTVDVPCQSTSLSPGYRLAASPRTGWKTN